MSWNNTQKGMGNSERRNESTSSLTDLYMQFELASAALLVVMSALTISTNVLLLSAIWKDPLKCFRTPTTYFIIGLAAMDLLTATSTEPFFAIFYFLRYLQGPQEALARHPWLVRIYEIGQHVSTVTISTSFLIVLALSWSQYIAIRYPHRYKIWVTRKRVVVSTVLILVYFLLFSLLPYAGIDMLTYLKVDLILHPTLISIILLVTLVLLYRSFHRQIKQRSALMRATRKTITDNLERQFTIVTLYLAGILLASALPHVIIQYVYLYKDFNDEADNDYISIAIRIRDLLLFLKVALDAFIYAWRLPTYRRALRKTIRLRKREKRLTQETQSLGMNAL